jgi:hypothetical protein
MVDGLAQSSPLEIILYSPKNFSLQESITLSHWSRQVKSVTMSYLQTAFNQPDEILATIITCFSLSHIPVPNVHFSLLKNEVGAWHHSWICA